MHRHTSRSTLAVWLSTLLVTSLAACGGPAATDGPGGSSPSAVATGSAGPTTAEPVTIQVGNKPTADRAEELEFWETQVAEFEAANPNITIEGVEVEYLDATYSALLASDQLPDVIGVPFTEPQGMFANGQIADITDTVKAIGLYDRINPLVLEQVASPDGRVYGIPGGGYAVGLQYNRALFEEAGLDPDDPPETWDEVRTAAKVIYDETGTFGLAVMATASGGGWTLTALTYAFGGTIETPDGSASAIAEGATQEALELLHAMRFEDGSLSDDLLLEWGSRDPEFAAGKFAMFVNAPDAYHGVVTNLGFPPENFGMAGMPDGGGNGTMYGGGVNVFNPKSSPAELSAAATWIEFSTLRQFTDVEVAKAQAQSLSESGRAVGVPFVSPVSEDLYAEYNEAIEEYVDVPIENFDPWINALESKELIREPPVKAQEVYPILDGLIQAVLTDPDADIPALVAEYDDKLNELLSR